MKNLKIQFKFCLLAVLFEGVLVIASCSKKSTPPPTNSVSKSALDSVMAFDFNNFNPAVKGKIVGYNITLNFPYGSAINNLRPSVKFSPNATINPDTNTFKDFTKGQNYTVTAEDGEHFKVYKVTAVVALNAAANIKTFSFATPNYNCSVNNIASTITGTLPLGTKLSKLIPAITLDDKAIVSPASGIAQDFSKPVKYTVTAQDNITTKTYTVTLVTAKSSAKYITAFSFNGLTPAAKAVIDTTAKTISATLPAGTDITKLVPTIVVSAKAKVSPTSGLPVDFTKPVAFTVTAEDGSTVAYTVNIMMGKSSAKDLLTFSFKQLNPVVNGIINNSAHTITAAFAPAVDPTSLTPSVTASPKATFTPTNGYTGNFSKSVAYKVIAEDGTVQNYTYKFTPPAASVKDTPLPPKYLCIYYGWPSSVNHSYGDINKASLEFEKYDIIVLGGGLELTSHPDYTNTVAIIKKVKGDKPGVKIYGYITVGVGPTKFTDAQLKQHIDLWYNMGVNGVFGDEFGYDFGVTRTRQNIFIDYAHSKSLSVFANAFGVNDALGGSDCHLGVNDYYLLESFLYAHGSYVDLGQFKARGDLAYYYMKTKKIGIAVTATANDPADVSNSSNTTSQFLQSWYGSAMYNFDAFQYTSQFYSGDASALLYFFPNPITAYGTGWKDFDWVHKASLNKYQRATNTTTLYITGDGAGNGGGGHTP